MLRFTQHDRRSWGWHKAQSHRPTDAMKDVVISIVNYRQPKLLDRCLAQLGSLSLPANWSTIVVDNDSGDGSGELVGRSYPWVQLIQLDRNTGYGGGHNTAFARSNSECFV